MYVIYVGDSKNIYRRLTTNHCRGNVEASALRRHVAEALGFRIRRERRPSGSTSVRIDLPAPDQGENAVSDYIRRGKWRTLVLDDYAVAHDFQWYVIEKLKPLLNRDYQKYPPHKRGLYGGFIQKLTHSEFVDCSSLNETYSHPGIYVLYHEQKPNKVLPRIS